MPSYYESLSMVALEAWGLGRPVLANGQCDVLQGQCIRSNAGLYYENYEEFVETLRAIESDGILNQALGEHGRRFFQAHYAWPVIERKYLDMLERLQRDDRRRGAAGQSSRCPGGSRGAAAIAAAGRIGARTDSGRSRRARRRRRAMEAAG